VRREVVDDDDIALERWHETLFDIRQEGLSGHGAIKHAWRGHSIAAQAGHEGDRLPVSVRHMADEPIAAQATAAKPQHFGISSGR
jgi:hypothetical protein